MKSKDRNHDQGRQQGLRRILLRVGVGWMLAITLLAIFPGIDRWAVQGTAMSVSQVPGVTKIDVAGADPYVRHGSITIQIVPACTSILATALVWSAMAAHSSTLGWKLVGMLVAGGVLWLYNMLRIGLTFVVLSIRPDWFELIHVYLWQVTTLLCVCGLFGWWIRHARSAPDKGPS